MKNLIYIFLFSSFIGSAQTLLYSENFDGPPPYQVSTLSIQNGTVAPTISWDTVSTLSKSAPNCFKVSGSATGTNIIFETNSFSTLGFPYIQLNFSHIGKLYLPNQAKVEYSTNGGTSWTPLPASSYLGSQFPPSPLYLANLYFNEGSYFFASSGINHWQSQSNSQANNTWWVNEIFDLRGVANDPVTFQGYTNFKLRFNAQFNFTTPPPNLGFHDGWYVDDLKVTGSTCSLTPSTISYDIGPSIYAPYKPIGDISANSSGNYKVSLTATNSNTIVSGVDLIYSINNVIDTTAMLAIPNTTDQFTFDFINLNVGDTVKWRTETRIPNCNNKTFDPNSGSYQFQIIPPFPQKCGTVFKTESPYVINSFPWEEDFESLPWVPGFGVPSSANSHRGSWAKYPDGNWQVSPNTDINFATNYAWGVGRNTIPGTGIFTGPNGNHTLGGQNYLYTAGNFNSSPAGTTISSSRIVTPCIELDQNNNYGFEFWYHAFGDDIGALRIDIDTGSLSTSWFNNYVNIVGEQQTNSFDPWKKVFVSLIPFKGKTIKIRFNSRKFTTGPNAVMALDDFSIFEYTPEKKDLEMDKVLFPVGLGCTFTNSEVIQIKFNNLGIDTLNIIPFAYQINNQTIIRDTLFHSGFSPFDTDTFVFAQTADLSAAQTYNFKIWSEVLNDTINTNDTLYLSVSSTASISTFPFLLNFENSISAQSFNGPGTGDINSNLFTLNANNNNPLGAKWKIYNDIVRKKDHGPVGGSQREGNYLLFQNEGTGTNSEQAIFESSCIDFSLIQNPQMSFLYHSVSPQTTLQVAVKDISSINWQIMSLNSISQIAKSADYNLVIVDLDQFSGKVVQFRLIAEKSNNEATNLAIDNLRIYDKKDYDYSLVTVNNPAYRLNGDINSLNISYTLANAGSLSNNRAMILKMKLTEICALTNPKIITGQTAIFTDFSNYRQSKSISKQMNFSDSLKSGRYRMKAWIEVAGDPEGTNDTIYRDILIVNGQSIPYFNDFEGCDSHFYGAGELFDWQKNDATKSGWPGSHSGQNSWITHPTEAGKPTLETLFLPDFLGFDSIYGARLQFWQNYDFGNGFGLIEYFNNGQWQNINPINGNNGFNWNVQFDPVYGHVFKANSSGWINSSFPLNSFNKSTTPLRLRFTSSFENSPGWAIDDFEIFVPEQNSASPVKMYFASGSLPHQGNNPITILVKNTGYAPLDELELNVKTNGVIQSQHYSLSSSLTRGQTILLTFNNPINLSIGSNNVQITTSRPNNRIDEILLDDTLDLNFAVLDLINTLPFCQDFEQEETFIGFDLLQSTTDSNWIYGSPNKSVLNSSHSGTKSWFTANQNYFPQQNQYLFTNEFLVNKNQCYELSFWHQYYTEFNFDGGAIEYSIDSGKVWLTLGNFNDSNWYNTPHIQSLNAVNPGWSGLSNGWEKVANIIQFKDSSKVQFRFRFSTSSILHFEGWAIDDFCFEPLAGSCSFIGSNEETPSFSRLDLFPNPSNHELNIIYNGALHGTSKMKIINPLGQVLNSYDREIQSGEQFTLATDHLPKGLFILLIEFNSGERISKSFEKK